MWVREAQIANARKQNINKTAQHLVGPCMNLDGTACSSDDKGEKKGSFREGIKGTYPADRMMDDQARLSIGKITSSKIQQFSI